MEKYIGPERFLETKDILDRYPKVKGRFYHGCPKKEEINYWFLVKATSKR